MDRENRESQTQFRVKENIPTKVFSRGEILGAIIASPPLESEHGTEFPDTGFALRYQ